MRQNTNSILSYKQRSKNHEKIIKERFRKREKKRLLILFEYIPSLSSSLRMSQEV